jgi:hypothetical protein
VNHNIRTRLLSSLLLEATTKIVYLDTVTRDLPDTEIMHSRRAFVQLNPTEVPLDFRVVTALTSVSLAESWIIVTGTYANVETGEIFVVTVLKGNRN